VSAAGISQYSSAKAAATRRRVVRGIGRGGAPGADFHGARERAHDSLRSP
jgi:hypothetical protein